MDGSRRGGRSRPPPRRSSPWRPRRTCRPPGRGGSGERVPTTRVAGVEADPDLAGDPAVHAVEERLEVPHHRVVVEALVEQVPVERPERVPPEGLPPGQDQLRESLWAWTGPAAPGPRRRAGPSGRGSCRRRGCRGRRRGGGRARSARGRARRRPGPRRRGRPGAPSRSRSRPPRPGRGPPRGTVVVGHASGGIDRQGSWVSPPPIVVPKRPSLTE